MLLKNVGLILEKYGRSSSFFRSCFEKISLEGEKQRLANDIQFIESYRIWKNYCESVYESAQINTDLFYRHCYFLYLGRKVLNQLISNHNSDKKPSNGSWELIEDYLSNFNVKLPNIIKKITEWIKIIDDDQIDISDFLKSDESEEPKRLKEHRLDVFGELYEDLFGFDTRHKSGEYYTEEFLAEAMVNDQYLIGTYCLDPACGAGVFLLCIVQRILTSDISLEQKIGAIDKLYGIDNNPFALFSSIMNLMLLARSEKIEKIPRLIEADFLFSELDLPPLDLIIGNPPWIVINGLKSSQYADKIKTLGLRYGIVRGAKYATTTEICTIFIYRALEFLKIEGKVFFVTPASLLNGEQHALFRQFKKMGDIKVWLFEKDIFRIHSICFLASRKDNMNNETIQAIKMGVSKNITQLIVKETLFYKPSYIEIKSNKIKMRLVGRYIPFFKDTTLPRIDSAYITQFKQGASLVPRSLVLVRIKEQIDDYAIIEPDPDLISKKDSNWDNCRYQETKVEKKYIFKAVKSTDMIPFGLISHTTAFLPIEKIEQNKKGKTHFIFSTKISQPFAQDHFQRILELYIQNQKDNAKILTLEQRLNYGHALTKPEQHSPLKVIYAGIGTIVKACFLKEPFIIDTSVYYYVPESEEEAYYLVAYLNSNIITENVRLIGSTGQGGSLRNIHKTPLKFGLKKFDKNNENHLKLVELGKSAENRVQEIIKHNLDDNKNKNKPLTRVKIQSIILQDEILKRIVREIDLYLKKEIN